MPQITGKVMSKSERMQVRLVNNMNSYQSIVEVVCSSGVFTAELTTEEALLSRSCVYDIVES